MLINKKKKYLFIYVPRTGGKYIEDIIIRSDLDAQIIVHSNRVCVLNLGGLDLERVEQGEFIVGAISDNPGLLNENNDTFYCTQEIPEMESKKMGKNTARCLRQQVTLQVLDGKRITVHIIHWQPDQNLFCLDTHDFRKS